MKTFVSLFLIFAALVLIIGAVQVESLSLALFASFAGIVGALTLETPTGRQFRPRS